MKLTKSKIFLICLIFFILGIALASYLPERVVKHTLVYFIAINIFLVITILFWQYKKISIIALFGLFLFFGVWRYAVSLPKNTPDKIWYYSGQELIIQGTISQEPDRRKNQKLEIITKSIKIQSQAFLLITGKILATTDLYPAYNYGDELSLVCQLEKPKEFDGFAYDRYLARYNIFSVCYYPKIKLLSANHGNQFYARLYKLKNKLRAIINRGLSEPESSLAKAIILGDKKGIPSDLQSLFSKAGISHLLAISGLHISIMVVILMSMLLGVGFKQNQAFYGVIIFLLIYILIVGLPASAMRAGLMSVLVLWALKLGRLNKISNSLMLVAVILLLINPRMLRDDIGFQLSFLAVMGIIIFHPIITDKLKKIGMPKLLGGRDVISASLSAQILTWPIVALYFSIISLSGPLVNLFVLWLVPVLLIVSLLGLAIGLFSTWLASLFFLPIKLIFLYIISIAKLFTYLPFSYLEVSLSWILILLYYLGLFYFIDFKKKN